MINTQVSVEVPRGETPRHETNPRFNKWARISSAERGTFGVQGGGYDNARPSNDTPTATTLQPAQETRSNLYAAGVAAEASRKGGAAVWGNCPPRPASPAPSHASSSTLSAATTSATDLSSRASLSSCRSLFTPCSSYSRNNGRSDRDGGSSRRSGGGSTLSYSSSRRSFSKSSSASGGCGSSSGGGGGVDYFPKPSSSWGGRSRDMGGVSRCRRGGGGGDLAEERRRDSHKDRCSTRGSRERHFFQPPKRRSGCKDYASEASSGSRKRNRSRSMERGSSRSSSRSSPSRKTVESCSSGVQCERCLEWCRTSRVQKKAITRTLQMDYWVRTPTCKAAKSKHIDFIDDVSYSREQFIEETVFTCPFTGTRRDIVLERNMFPYDVPTDVEHWTLWSRRDLPNDEMEAFVQRWAAENHPHAVEWECDNNEGERSIDWFHVHVFFRLGCEDRTGIQRDPASMYDGPCHGRAGGDPGEEEEEGRAAVGVVVGGGSGDDGDGEGASEVVTDCE